MCLVLSDDGQSIWRGTLEHIILDNDGQMEIIVSTIAVLLAIPPTGPVQVGIAQDALVGILKRPLTVSDAPGGQTIISSNRDQIEVQLFPNKLDVRDVSGKAAEGRRKIPRVLTEFLALLANPTITSVGINFIVELPQAEPTQWLGTNLLDANLATRLGSQPTCNDVALVLNEPPKVLNVRFTAQGSDRLNVNFNASEVTQELPSPERLEQDLQEQFDRLHRLVKELEL